MMARALSFDNDLSAITIISNCTRISIPSRKSTSTAVAFLSRNSRFFNLLCRKRNYEVGEGVKFNGPMIRIDDIVNIKDIELAFENCVSRTFSPALTLEEGLEKIKEAVQILRLDPPYCSSGFFRFQVYMNSIAPGGRESMADITELVVEAIQNFVPLILLTADRPPELQECGANQAIYQ